MNRLSSRTFASTDHRRRAVPLLVIYIITTFVELSNPFPHHSTTPGILTTYFTYLAMNNSRFHVSCIRKMNNRPYFTVGGALDHLEHFKRTEQYVNTIYFSLWLANAWEKTARMREITISALRRKYSQTVLTFRIRFVPAKALSLPLFIAVPCGVIVLQIFNSFECNKNIPATYAFYKTIT